MKNLLFLFLLIVSRFLAQDIRGAYLKAEWVTRNDFIYEYKITVNLFTDATMDVPRPTIRVHYGVGGFDGTFPLVATICQNGICIKTYSVSQVFPGSSGQGYYQVSYVDSFRVAGIKNIPNPEMQKIYVDSRIFANNISRTNNPVQINNLPFNNLSVQGDKVIYNPACTDADGDSLTYELISCYVPQYHLPVGATVNYSTGVVSVPKDSLGLYAYSLQINEFERDEAGVPAYAHTTWFDFTLDITLDVGLSENSSVNQYLKISPNPFSDKLSIKSMNGSLDITTLNITNGLGQIVFEQKAVAGDQQLDLSSLPAGIYFLKLETAEGNRVQKIIKE